MDRWTVARIRFYTHETDSERGSLADIFISEAACAATRLLMHVHTFHQIFHAILLNILIPASPPPLPLQNQQLTTKLCVTSLPPCLFDHTPPGVFDGQGSGHDYYGTLFMPPTGFINNCDGGRSHTYCDYRQE